MDKKLNVNQVIQFTVVSCTVQRPRTRKWQPIIPEENESDHTLQDIQTDTTINGYNKYFCSWNSRYRHQ